MVNPRDLFHERSGDRTQDPCDDEREAEEAAVGDPSRSAADAADGRAARLAGTGGAARGQA